MIILQQEKSQNAKNAFCDFFTYSAFFIAGIFITWIRTGAELIYGKAHFGKDGAGIVFGTFAAHLVGYTVFACREDKLGRTLHADHREETKRHIDILSLVG